MNPCPPELELERFLAGELPVEQTTRIDAHLGDCATCRSFVAGARTNDDLLVKLRRVELPKSCASTPDRIGNYRVLREIGAGGMGIVYEAEQDNPKRRVALKVMRPGLLTPRALRRFEHESRALGRLQHQGIARILEAGTFGTGTNAQPFFAMEFVSGSSLTEYVRDRQLSRPARLRLFGKLCGAVQHAHEKGVVHRDLKPGNILVDESGRPKILDFGIARLQDDDTAHTLRTHAGQLVGTLAYMSPEQVSGDPDAVDTRSDVHALGVLLYELLTGALPYDVAGKSTPEVVRMIAEAEPVPITIKDPSLRGDLATIVHTCLAKEPGRRYPSAVEVEHEVQRFLDHEPLQARPPSAAYHLAKFTRRHRGLVGGILAAFVMLVVGFVVALEFWRQAAAAAEVAGRKQRQAEIEAAQAEAAREFMQEVLIQASPRQRAGGVTTLRDVLATAAEKIDYVKEPLVEAAVRHTLGRVFSDLGELDNADRNLSCSLELYETAYGRHHVKIAYVLTNLAQLRQKQARYADALALAERVIGWQDEPGSPSMPAFVLGTAYLSAGHAAYSRGDIDLAERYYRRAVAIQEMPGADSPEDLASSQASLALVYGRRGKTAEAEKMFRAALETRARVLGEQNPASLVTMGNLANLLEGEARFEEAEVLRRDALAIARKSYGDSHQRVGFCLRALGYVEHLRGKSEAGLVKIREGLAIQEKSMGRTHPRVAQSLELLARVLRGVQQFDEALRVCRRATKLAHDAFGAGHPLTIQTELGLGQSLLALGRFTEAELTLRKCAGLAKQKIPWAKGTVIATKRAWIEALIGLEKTSEARSLLRQLAAESSGTATGEWATEQLGSLGKK